MKSPDGTVLAWSPGAEALYGHRAAEILGRHVSMIVPASRRGEEMALIAQVLRGSTISEHETTRIRKDGSTVVVSLTMSPVHDEAGAVMGVSVVARDVSARKYAEAHRDLAIEHLKAMRDSLQSAFEHSPLGILRGELTERGLERCTSVNETLCSMAGCSEDELLGTPPMSLVASEDAYKLQVDLGLLASGALHRVEREVRLLRRDGRRMWTLWSAARLPGRRRDGMIAVIFVHDIEARKRVELQLEHSAHHDPLTGLHNRRWIERELERLGSESGAHGALLMIDLDGLKQVNDTLGHAAGDECIATAAVAIRCALSLDDSLARVGGDEFVAILPGADETNALGAANKVIDAVRHRTVPSAAAFDGGLTTSVGVAAFNAGSCRVISDLVAQADAAMYQAKQSGKNRVVCFRAGGSATADAAAAQTPPLLPL